VINTNLPHTSYRTQFPNYGQIFASDRGSLQLSPSLGVNIRINLTSPETRVIVLPDAKNHTIVSSFV